MNGSKVPILTYHSLDESRSVISVAPRTFNRQMRMLAARGFTAIRFDELVNAWETNAALPARPVVLTFDDGFVNVMEHAAPLLAELGFRATIFAVAGHCGGFNDWPSQTAGITRLPLLSFRDLTQLAAQGFEIGGHSLTHARLNEAAPASAQKEVVDSKQILEDGVGTFITTFAYPYGLMSSPADKLVRHHYRGACTTKLAMARRGDDPHLLPRIEMYYWRARGIFRWFGTPAGTAYLQLRALARRIRG